MKYATAASGVEAPSVAFKNLKGWKPVWFSQYDPEHNYKLGPDFPSRVLAYHYPHVPNLGDMLKLHKNPIFHESVIDLLCAGTPCQGFSLAGLREGLADDRSNLALEFCRILLTKKPRWFLWENVPGVHSTFSNEAKSKSNKRQAKGQKKGRKSRTEDLVQSSDFATLLQAFQECGYSVSWRILDSKHFGVPQRRRRVYVVGHLGTDWRPPFAVLFEQGSLRGDFAQGKKKGKATAASADAGTKSGDIDGAERDAKGSLVPCWWDGGQTSQTLDAVLNKGQALPEKNRFPAVIHPAIQTQSIDVRNLETKPEISGTLQAKKDGKSLNYINPVVYPAAQITQKNNRSNPQKGDPCPTLHSDGVPHIVINDQGGDYISIEKESLSPTLRAESHNHLPIIVHDKKKSKVNNENIAFKMQPKQNGATSSMAGRQIIRRLTPIECERLQAFPDNYTRIPLKKVSDETFQKSNSKHRYDRIDGQYWLMAADGPRYQAMGNSMTTTVIKWIGTRIDKVDKLMKKINKG